MIKISCEVFSSELSPNLFNSYFLQRKYGLDFFAQMRIHFLPNVTSFQETLTKKLSEEISSVQMVILKLFQFEIAYIFYTSELSLTNTKFYRLLFKNIPIIP